MWVHIPSGYCPSAPGPEDWTSESTWLYEALGRSATWNTKSLPARSWQRVFATVPWMTRLFGRTPRPSMADAGADAWTGYWRRTHASLFPSPDSGAEPKTPGISGLEYQGSFEMLSPSGASSKTCEGTCDSDCAKCGAIFDAWVTKFEREYSRRRRLARPVRYWPPISWPGQPTIEGHVLSAQFVADQAARRGMAAVMEDFEMTKADVMVCLWWAGQYGRSRHRKEWGEWSDEAWKHLWSSCVNVPLPPGVPS